MRTTLALAAAMLALPPAAVDDPATLARDMPALAAALLATDGGRANADVRFRLQVVAGRYAAADETLSALRRRNDPRSPWSSTTYAHDAMFIHAKELAATGIPFDEAFSRAFRRDVGALDDRTSALIIRRLAIRPSVFEAGLRTALEGRRGTTSIPQADAVALVRTYYLAMMYRAMVPRAVALIAADDRRRYIIDRDHLIATPGGGRICALIVRPRHAGRLPALLQFSIYGDRMANLSEARRTASNRYVAVEALTRGKGCSPNTPVPYERDGADAAAVIDWISRQPWSDGRVGMYGGSYNSFAQWAAAKHAPRALKALMPSVPNAPGIDTPMEANVFQSWSYDWPFYATTSKWLDASTQGDSGHWIALQKRWYVSGKSYRSMDVLDGRPNPIWDRWLRHPSYDAFWQRYIPHGREFARIGVPVLITDGYLSGQNTGGLYYFENYHRFNPHAEDYLVLGPYDHIAGQRGTPTSQGPDLDAIAGFPIDPAAHLDIGELRYQWFDYVFKGAEKPAILHGNVNYEVMGANRWKHAASIGAMADRTLRFHLGTTRAGDRYGLMTGVPARDAYVEQRVDFKDRSDVNRVSPPGLDTYLSLAFESAPFETAFDLTGRFSGRLDFVTNKKDFDFNLSLYELTPAGAYVPVTYAQMRASYVADRSHRRLFTPGRRTQLDFAATRLTAWRFAAGSRLVVLLSIVKDPGIQINYGTGKDVSVEDIADARVPLRIRWFGRSYLDIPVSRP